MLYAGDIPNDLRVRVFQITSMTDPETMKPGKRIELVEVRQQRAGQPFGVTFGPGSGDEARVVRGIMDQFQSMGLFPFRPEMANPKINLFLTETEYDMLGIRFEVNEVYELTLKDGAITFSKPTEGV